MLKRIQKIIILFCIFNLAFPLIRTGSSVDKRIQLLENYQYEKQTSTINISQVLEDVIKKYPLVKVSLYELIMTDSDFNKYLTQYSPYLSVSTGYGETNSPPGGLSALIGTEVKDFNMQLVAGKKFETGTDVSIGVANNFKKANPLGVDTSLNNFNVIVSIQQQLLKNYFGINDQLTKEIVELQKYNKDVLLKYQLSQIAASILVDYWNTTVAYRNLCDSEIEILVYQVIRDRLKENQKIGLIEPFVLNQFNALVFMTEVKVQKSKFDYNQALNSIKKLFDTDEEIHLLPFYNDNKTYHFDIDEVLELALEKRADYIQASNNVLIAENNLRIQKNSFLPDLNLKYQHVGVGSKSDIVDSFSDSILSRYNNWELSLSLLCLFDNKAGEIAVRDAAFRYEQSLLERDRVKNSIKYEIINAIELYNFSTNSLKTIQLAGKEIDSYINSLFQKLAQGIVSTTVLREAVDMLVQYRMAQTQAINARNLALLNIDMMTNSFFENQGIDLLEYIRLAR